jgi:hypothetical protein
MDSLLPINVISNTSCLKNKVFFSSCCALAFGVDGRLKRKMSIHHNLLHCIKILSTNVLSIKRLVSEQPTGGLIGILDGWFIG